MRSATVTTFAQLLAGLDDDTIVARIAGLYPDEKTDGYRQVLATLLRRMAPEPSTCKLTLGWVTTDPGEPWIDVYGVEDDTTYAIEYTPWAQWLGMDVAAETLARFPAVDIAAHALWEMTYAGFDEQAIAEQLEEIRRPVGG